MIKPYKEALWAEHVDARTMPVEASLSIIAGYDRALVEAIYDARSAYVLRIAARAGPGSSQGRMLQSIARNRYPAELAAALAMVRSPPSA